MLVLRSSWSTNRDAITSSTLTHVFKLNIPLLVRSFQFKYDICLGEHPQRKSLESTLYLLKSKSRLVEISPNWASLKMPSPSVALLSSAVSLLKILPPTLSLIQERSKSIVVLVATVFALMPVLVSLGHRLQWV